MGKLTVVVDGQYGSCGKGHATGYLSRQSYAHTRVAVRVGGSNAGHTTYDDNGNVWSLRHVPVTAVVDRAATLVIARGSEIDHEVLADEVDKLDRAGFNVSRRLKIDLGAVMVTEGHKRQEAQNGLTVDSGKSTGKGVGAARAARALRKAYQAKDFYGTDRKSPGEIVNTEAGLRAGAFGRDVEVFIEGIQGHGLSVYGPHYPDGCTSAGTDVVDMLSMARINPLWFRRDDIRVVNVMRTRPIRIAGNSGYLAGETTWEKLGLESEITTVTKKVRRVGEWDPDLAASAVKANTGTVWLSMFDQLFPEIAGKTNAGDLQEPHRRLLRTYQLNAGAPIEWVGTGPQTVIETPGGVR